MAGAAGCCAYSNGGAEIRGILVTRLLTVEPGGARPRSPEPSGPGGRGLLLRGAGFFLPSVALILLVLAGCAGRGVGPPPASGPAPDCVVLDGAPRAGGPLIVATNRAVDPADAPVPRNDAERVAFRQLYQTLVDVDCDGIVRPALAAAWRSIDSDRVWIVELRSGQRFSDGSSLRAADVRLCWLLQSRQARGRGDVLPWEWLDPARVEVLDETRLRISLPAPMPRLPLLLGNPALAVGVPRPGRVWPVGSGPYEVDPGAGAAASELTCRRNPYYDGTANDWDPLVFRLRPGWDSRDLPATEADLFLIRDRSALRYIGSTGEYRTAPLPWDRFYLLLLPPFDGREDLERDLDRLDREELAGVAIPSDGRAARSVLFGDDAQGSCPAEQIVPLLPQEREDLELSPSGEQPAGSTGTNAAPDPRRILYDKTDPDARRLAERIAALSAADRGGAGVAVPEASGAFAASLLQGREFAYVAALRRTYADDCLNLLELLQRTPWLAAAAWPQGASGEGPKDLRALADLLVEKGWVVPLVSTRPHLVARWSLAGVEIDGTGALRLERAGWTAGVRLP
jgi:hypothetical protein